MNNLLTKMQGTIVISNHKLADGFGVEVRAINKLIETHRPSIESFGVLDKVIGNTGSESNIPRGGKNKITYWLNKNQAMFLITYTKKTEKTNQFRIDLINAFDKLNSEIKHASSLLLEAQKLMNDYQLKGKDWSAFGKQLKIRKPLIARALRDAEQLSQMELKI